MKVKHRKHIVKKGGKWFTSEVTIPKIFMDQCKWQDTEYFNISMGCHSNGKPFLMISGIEK